MERSTVRLILETLAALARHAAHNSSGEMRQELTGKAIEIEETLRTMGGGK